MKPDVRGTVVGTDAKATAFPPVKQEFRILLAEAAFDAVVSHGAGDTTREVGGILVGELLADECGPYIRVDATIEALHADEKGAELTFTHATWEHVNKEMDSRFGPKRILGWYHTHPGFGVFLSDRDRFIHRSFFGEPFQIAFVYDPTRREHGVFAWRDGEPRRWRRYAVGDREHLYDGSVTDDVAPAGKNGKPRKTGVKTGAKTGGKTGTAAEDDGADAESGDTKTVFVDRGGSDPRAAVLYSLGIAVFGLIAGVLGGTWFASRNTEALLLQQREQFMQAQVDTTRQSIALVGDQMAEVLRAAVGEASLSRPITEVDSRSKRAAELVARALEKNATPESRDEAQKAVVDARAAAANLQASWGGAQEMLARLDRAAHALATPGAAGKEQSRQRVLVGQLFAELAEQAVRDRDLPRADRLLLTAVDAHPDGRDRYTRRRHDLGLDKPAAAVAAPAAGAANAANPVAPPPGKGP